MQSERPANRQNWIPPAILIALGTAAITCLAFALVAIAIGRAQTAEFEQHGRTRMKLVQAFARACRRYCADYLRPALQRIEAPFVIEGMSATYMTQQILRYVAQEYPGLQYRQAAPNPLNPAHLPSPFEQELLERFRTTPGLEQVDGMRNTARGRVYYVASPIRAEARCLRCHGSPDKAPIEVRERYGTTSGYGWKEGDVVGVLMVTVPVADILASQARVRRVVHGTTMAVSLVLSAALGILLLLLMRWNWKLRLARRQAEAASNAKSAFLATMSHEIRTPLTAILGYADELARTAQRGQLPPDACEAVDAIRTSGRHLLDLINDILDLARVEAGRIVRELADVSLPGLIHDVCSIMRVRATEKGLRLAVRVCGQLPAVVRVDPAQLRQILVNLVGNAVKFTDHGEVAIELSADRQSESRSLLTIRVQDTGIGIPADKLDELFEPFVQVADSAVARAQGTGLGLTVTKRLVELAGGTITVQSQLGAGTTFTITMPVFHKPDVSWLDEAAFARAYAERSTPTDEDIRLDGIRVLLCEDNPLNARLVQRMIERAGGSCEHVPDGRQAVTYFETRSPDRWPDLVLMDLQMPVMDGLTATERLRSMGVHIPVVALSANVMKDDRDRCLAVGFSDYVSKPIDRAELLRRIIHHVRASKRSCPSDVASP